MPKSKLFVYGWFMVVIGWLCYGFGISPAYYSWGNFSGEIVEDLALDRTKFGGIFGLFTIMYSCVGIFVGPAMARWGIRRIMVFGFVVSSIGFLYLSRADSLLDCFIGFSILGGGGIGFATIIPCQTLGQNWFLKNRALALAIIFTAGGIVGLLVARFDTFMLAEYDWRTGWVVIGIVSAVLAVTAALFVRNTPEQVGLHRDGMSKEEEERVIESMLSKSGGAAAERWTALDAMRTPQFALMVLCGIAYAVPWGVVVPHMRFHLEGHGFELATAIGLTGTMALISIAGRVLATFGDYVPPQAVLAVSLALEAIGTGGLIYADSLPVAYLCITLIGLGFGTAYISVPVVFTHFFGRKAFGVTSGVRITITGIFNGIGPALSGYIFDRTGSYTIALIGLVVLGLAGAVSAALLRHPGAPPEPAQEVTVSRRTAA